MPRCHLSTRASQPRLAFNPLQLVARRDGLRLRTHAAQPSRSRPEDDEIWSDTVALPDNFCIIEDRSTVKDFASLQLTEIEDGIQV